MQKYLYLALSAILSVASVASARPSMPVTSHEEFLMNIYLGQRLFENRVILNHLGDGVLLGTLIVPNRFVAQLRNLQIDSDTLSFDIVADENGTLLRASYRAHFVPGTDTFTGVATVTDDGSLIGGFVGLKLEEKPLPAGALVVGASAKSLFETLMTREHVVGGIIKKGTLKCSRNFERPIPQRDNCFLSSEVDGVMVGSTVQGSVFNLLEGGRERLGNGYAQREADVSCLSKNVISNGQLQLQFECSLK